MADTGDPRPVLDRLEALIHTDVGRHIEPLFAAAHGGLGGAARILAEAKTVGLITGFYVPLGTPPAAETDGPVGAALLARSLRVVGIGCRLATDTPCRDACAAALAGASAADVPIDTVAPGAPLADLIETWREAGVDCALAIERCGQSGDGRPHNMRGEDIGAHTASLDMLFTAGPWRTIAIGDGGNEIGMGALPAALIADCVDHGERIACVTPAQHLVVSGVSNWGAYALIAALAVLRPAWRARLLACLDADLDRAILEALVEKGPAVDGVSRGRTLTVDNFDLPVHHEKLHALRAVVETCDER